MSKKKKITPFSKLARHKKKDLYFQLKKKIKQTVGEFKQTTQKSHRILTNPLFNNG